MTNGILLTWHNQGIAQWSPDPFPCERVGSGHETMPNPVLVMMSDDASSLHVQWTSGTRMEPGYAQ